jgi:hypothetical protein
MALYLNANILKIIMGAALPEASVKIGITAGIRSRGSDGIGLRYAITRKRVRCHYRWASNLYSFRPAGEDGDADFFDFMLALFAQKEWGILTTEEYRALAELFCNCELRRSLQRGDSD